ncbi:hypothetical protein EHS25_005787 [Saitozyma podzolica]|uniref:Uncharacterized protein n=1 Tax=Saitozyma podzolica TaxID=1890683 RepID=A0A427XVG5_9TREE|nr:hypothetical protein EHS25_005787 [Saitozyma podzolica]
MQIDGQTLPKIWIYICHLWIFVAVGALIMPLIAWILIFAENIDTYHKTMHLYLGNDMSVYDTFSPPSDSGYVNETNIPKHLGGAVFASCLDFAMIIMILISLASELFWKFPFAKNVLLMMWTPGLWNEANMDAIEYFFLIANAFLKIFIVAVTGAQTYTGLTPDTPGGVDTPLFCLYATMILLGSIPLTIIAQMFVLQSAKHAAWGGIRAKQDEEMKAAAKAEGVKEGQKAAAEAAAKKSSSSKK